MRHGKESWQDRWQRMTGVEVLPGPNKKRRRFNHKTVPRHDQESERALHGYPPEHIPYRELNWRERMAAGDVEGI